MNLIKEYLGSVAGVNIFAIISLFIFLIGFAFLLFETFSIKRESIKEYGNIPLEDENGRLNHE